MKRLAIVVSVCARSIAAIAVLGSVTAARADSGLPPAPAGMDPEDAVNPSSVVTGAGIKIGEGTVFQPQLGIETGIVSNVFYENTTPITAGLFRILAEVGTGTLPNQRLELRGRSSAPDDPDAATETLTAPSQGDFQYSANLFATWDQYLSTDNRVSAQGGLGGGLLLRGIVNPQRALRFSFQDFFTRVIRATNFESLGDTNRDRNELSLRLAYVPEGRSLSGFLYFNNTIDVFEASTQQFANRLHNTLGLRVNWQWLPLTGVFADVSAGYFTGLGSGSQKVNSLPITAQAGIQTLLSLNLTVNAHVGYTNGFYSQGPSYSSLLAGLMVGYRYSPLGRATALYAYNHADSINANFYRDHLFQMSFEQFFAPFVVVLRPEMRLRQYEGTIVMGSTGSTRNDLIVGASAGVRYAFRDWIAGTIDYSLSSVSTDFRYTIDGVMLDPSYVRHELLVGVRAAY